MSNRCAPGAAGSSSNNTQESSRRQTAIAAAALAAEQESATMVSTMRHVGSSTVSFQGGGAELRRARRRRQALSGCEQAGRKSLHGFLRLRRCSVISTFRETIIFGGRGGRGRRCAPGGGPATSGAQRSGGRCGAEPPTHAVGRRGSARALLANISMSVSKASPSSAGSPVIGSTTSWVASVRLNVGSNRVPVVPSFGGSGT